MIREIIKKIVLSIRESKNPLLYAQRILNHSEILPPLKIVKRNHVHVNGAIMWDFLTPFTDWNSGQIRIWHYTKNNNDGSGRLIPRNYKFELLSQLVEQHQILAWETDISQLHGFSSSKSTLTDFESLHDMVLINSQPMIEDVSEQGLVKNLAHNQIRIINSPTTSDFFVRYAWDGRLYLVNAGGSHHLAAAKYIAFKLNKNVSLKARYVEYSLNRDVLKKLIYEYRIFLIDERSDDFHEALLKALGRLQHDFVEVELSVHICEHGKLLFLFSKYKETKAIADLLTKRGFQDIGALLMDQYAKQKMFYKSN